jgi:hypothetical protein
MEADGGAALGKGGVTPADGVEATKASRVAMKQVGVAMAAAHALKQAARVPKQAARAAK